MGPASSDAAELVRREVRLKPAYAHLYPGLEPGVWYSAAAVADYFRHWLSRHPGLVPDGGPRRLDGEHFDCRGGAPRAAPWVPGVSPDERAPEIARPVDATDAADADR